MAWKDDDYDEEAELFQKYQIEKTAVVQEVRVFNNTPLDIRRCEQVLMKLLYLINQGETFTKAEATDIFFSVTKLFQSKVRFLRRMVHLMLKEVSPSSDEVIMAASSLIKDMNGTDYLYRANAIRVLSRITDIGLLNQIERYLKQAVVDMNPAVSSSALVTGIHLLKVNSEVIRRWSNEVQNAVESKAPMVQFHGLLLQHRIKQNDRLALSKLVTGLTRAKIGSPITQCLLLRYCSEVLKESAGNVPGGAGPYVQYFESCFRNKPNVVTYESARMVTLMDNISTRELWEPIHSLHMLLNSAKPIERFAAVRTLNKIATMHPVAVSNCNFELEGMISDVNRGVASLAITTLLKTGNEDAVDRLMSKMAEFMVDVPDDFKIIVVDGIRSLCLKFPQKCLSLMSFLSIIWRQKGGLDYKKAILESILVIVEQVPEVKESGLAHLCDFIEDCEFPYLSLQIIHLLGIEGPKTMDPGNYIRHIYNRLALEKAAVRACAVSSLAKFGLYVDSLSPRISMLLRRCICDDDDEVRDRATLYLSTLETNREEKSLLLEPLEKPLANLEASLQSYVASDVPFDIAAVPTEVKAQRRKMAGNNVPPKGFEPTAAANAPLSKEATIPGFSNYGKLLKSCQPVDLTEPDLEYVVNVVKHIYPEHVIFEFNCSSTFYGHVLERVSVSVDAAGADDFQEISSRTIPCLAFEDVCQAYVVFKKLREGVCIGRFSNTLKYVIKEIDPTTGEPVQEGISDEYPLEVFEVTASDYFLRNDGSSFRTTWDTLEFEHEDEYALDVRDSLQQSVQEVVSVLGLQPEEGTETVAADARSHTVLLSARFIDGSQVLVRLAFGISETQVMMKVVARAEKDHVCQLIHEIISN